jgi:hypothetical protein
VPSDGFRQTLAFIGKDFKFLLSRKDAPESSITTCVPLTQNRLSAIKLGEWRFAEVFDKSINRSI